MKVKTALFIMLALIGLSVVMVIVTFSLTDWSNPKVASGDKNDKVYTGQAEPVPQNLKNERALFEASIYSKLSSLEHGSGSLHSPEYKEGIELLLKEATRLYNLTPSQINSIKSGQLYIGMTESLLFLAWGRTSRMNKTTTQNGESIQYVYTKNRHNVWRPFVPGGSQYAYTDNGILISWQE